MSASRKIAVVIHKDRAIVIRPRTVRHIKVKEHPESSTIFYEFKRGKMVKWLDLNEAPF